MVCTEPFINRSRRERSSTTVRVLGHDAQLLLGSGEVTSTGVRRGFWGVVAVASPGITGGALAVLFAVWSLSSATAPASQSRPTEEAAPWTQPPA
jgi:hypothetical protein